MGGWGFAPHSFRSLSASSRPCSWSGRTIISQRFTPEHRFYPASPPSDNRGASPGAVSLSLPGPGASGLKPAFDRRVQAAGSGSRNSWCVGNRCTRNLSIARPLGHATSSLALPSSKQSSLRASFHALANLELGGTRDSASPTQEFNFQPSAARRTSGFYARHISVSRAVPDVERMSVVERISVRPRCRLPVRRTERKARICLFDLRKTLQVLVPLHLPIPGPFGV